jgi:UDP-glucose 4-epimerase
MLLQLMAGKTEIALGRLDPKRDLTYVSDTVEGFIKAGGADGVEGEEIHLGTGRTVSIAELFDIACSVLKRSARVVQDDARLRPGPSEVMVLLSDPTKARARLGWEPSVTIEEGIARTARWLSEHGHRFSVDRYHV